MHRQRHQTAEPFRHLRNYKYMLFFRPDKIKIRSRPTAGLLTAMGAIAAPTAKAPAIEGCCFQERGRAPVAQEVQIFE